MRPCRVTLQASNQIKRVLVWARDEVAARIKARRENQGFRAQRAEAVNV